MQEEAVARRENTLFLLQHPPVITEGRQADRRELRDPGRFPVVPTGRGGRYTYHGPGQLVAYPVLDLSGRPDLHRYLRDLEQVLIEVAVDYGLPGVRIEGRTGVWVRGSKLAAIGVRASRWMVWHGAALNVEADLSGFEAIVPCGIEDAGVTSLAAELGWTPPMDQVEDRFEARFRAVFNLF